MVNYVHANNVVKIKNKSFSVIAWYGLC